MAVPAHPFSDPVDRAPGTPWCDYGTGVDMDAAYDDAVDAGIVDLGRLGVAPGIAAHTLDDVNAAPSDDALPWPAAAAAALAAASAGDPGGVHAWPVATDSAYQRTRLTVRTQRLDIDWPAGPVPASGPAVELARELAAEAGRPLTDGQFIESITVTATRARVKPAVAKNTAARRAGIAAVTASGQILAIAATASAARRAVVAAIKDGRLAPGTQVHLLSIAGRDLEPCLELPWSGDGIIAAPASHVSITADVVARRTTAKIVVAERRDPAKAVKITGWMFAGR